MNIEDSGSLTIYGQENQTGKMTVNGNNDSTDRYGINSKGDITVNGGQITVSSGDADSDYADSGAIYCKDADLTVNAGSLTCTAGKSSFRSLGLTATNITINGGMLEATTPSSNTGGCYAVRVSNGLTVNGGTINATAGSSSVESAGIYSEGSIIINGGSVTATSSTGGRGYNNSGIDCSSGSFLMNSGALIAKAADGNKAVYGNPFTQPESAPAEMTTTEPQTQAPAGPTYYYAPVDKAIEAPKTFDGGVAVYGLLAVSSLTGMVWVRRRHD